MKLKTAESFIVLPLDQHRPVERALAVRLVTDLGFGEWDPGAHFAAQDDEIVRTYC